MFADGIMQLSIRGIQGVVIGGDRPRQKPIQDHVHSAGKGYRDGRVDIAPREASNPLFPDRANKEPDPDEGADDDSEQETSRKNMAAQLLSCFLEL
jgi:hypothetical protein